MKHSDAPGAFDSWHEFYVECWCRELLEAGMILDYSYPAETFELCPGAAAAWKKEGVRKDREMSQAVLRGHVYTPDFKILLADDHPRVFRHYHGGEYHFRHKGLWACRDLDGRLAVYLEVKGAGGTTRFAESKKREAVINQKWLFSQHQILTNLAHIGPGSRGQTERTFFERTFTPFRFLVTDKTLKQRRLHYTPRRADDWVASSI